MAYFILVLWTTVAAVARSMPQGFFQSPQHPIPLSLHGPKDGWYLQGRLYTGLSSSVYPKVSVIIMSTRRAAVTSAFLNLRRLHGGKGQWGFEGRIM